MSIQGETRELEKQGGAMTPAEATARYDELKDTVIALLSDELTPEERMTYLKIRVRELKAAIAKHEFLALTEEADSGRTNQN